MWNRVWSEDIGDFGDFDPASGISPHGDPSSTIPEATAVASVLVTSPKSSTSPAAASTVAEKGKTRNTYGQTWFAINMLIRTPAYGGRSGTHGAAE